jgi:hypothetical protein
MTNLLGKREVKDFWADLGNSLLGQVTDAANSLLSSTPTIPKQTPFHFH